MKNSHLASVSRYRYLMHRLFVLAIATSSVLCQAALAQDKPLEPSHAAGWVVIPVDEYRVLRAKAYPVERDPEPPRSMRRSRASTTSYRS